MNIKRNISKLVSGLLCFSMIFSNVLPVYAADAVITENTLDGEDLSVNERNLEDITVTYKQASSFFVTIPKTIVLDGWKQSTYAVKVSGDIDAEQCVYVAPVDMIAGTENIDFYMKDQASENTKDDVVASVTHNKFHWNSAEVTEGYRQDDNLVSAPELTAGAWKGIFQMEIKLETKKAHEHNYVDGKCECGAIDPNHTHNYENGTCTICGEKDSYTVAPAEAYSNWNYTLDDTNNTITLNYYTGSETDVIVYANYVIGGKTYKTQIASNSASATDKTVYMFNGQGKNSYGWSSKSRYIKSIKFSKDIDTSNVTNMKYMFYYCAKLTDLDISCFDTSNVTDMQYMFRNCESLTSLDVCNFDTSKVINMEWMFSYCKALTSLDLSNFDTSSVTNMSSMFHSSSNLASMDLSNFDTSNVTDISYMFDTCSNLENLNLSSFDTSKVTDMTAMFQHCSALSNIYVTKEKWSTSQAKTSYMFNNCGTSTVTYK